LPALVRCTRTFCWAFGVVAPPAADAPVLGRAVLAALPLNSCQPPFFAMSHPEPLVPILVGAAPGPYCCTGNGTGPVVQEPVRNEQRPAASAAA
jgi:hypothetical protein